MSKFWFGQSGETIPAEYAAAGFTAVVSAPPPSAPSAGNQWVLGSPQAVQDASGTWVPNWVQEAIPLATAQQQALATVAATLAARISAGFTYSGVLIACDAEAQSAIGHVVEMANAILDNRTTKTWVSRTWPAMQIGATGVPVSTPQDLIDLGDAVGMYVADNKFHALDLEAQIKARTATASSIAALDLDNSQGTWPTS